MTDLATKAPPKFPAFATMVREARRNTDPQITQQGMAEVLGVNQPAVSAWETGRAIPELGTLVDLAVLLGLDLEVLARTATARCQD